MDNRPYLSHRLAYRLYTGAWAGIDLLFPPHCGGCGKLGTRWCPDCQQKTKAISNSVCDLCGQVVDLPGLCARCQVTRPDYRALRSCVEFSGPLRQAMHRLKYKGDVAMGEILAHYLIDKLDQLAWNLDLVLAVPLALARQKERGYNQALLLARPLAYAKGLALDTHGLKKVRDTRTQVGLTTAQRRQNLDQAFEADPKHVNGKKILLVDDVTTSGATIEACTEALIDAGAQDVYALTLARALLANTTPNRAEREKLAREGLD